MKKIISFILSFILVLSSLQVVLAETNGDMENFKKTKTYIDGQFSDVSGSDWFAESMKNAYELGLISGTSETTFNPNANITLAETITLASRLNNTYYGNTHTFNSSEVWYQTYVDYAIEKGIIKSAEYTDLNAFATRSQFAQIFVNALPEVALKEINEVDDYFIPDVPMQEEYTKSVYKLYRAGIITGNDDKGTFTPNTNIQRSAVAAIVSRMATEELRTHATFKLSKLHLVNLGELYHLPVGIKSIIKYNGKLYVFSSSAAFYPYIERKSKDVYYGDNNGHAFEIIFGEPRITDSENPFVEGRIDFNEPFSYEEERDYISATEFVNVYTITYKDKTFKTPSAQEYLSSDIMNSEYKTGIYNGVRFYFWGRGMYLNYNDLAKFFDVDFSASYGLIEEIGEVGLIINK